VGVSFVRSVYQHWSANDWQQVAATVTAIENHQKSADLVYAYIYDGMHFTGDTFAFLSKGSLNDKELINERYRVGDRIDIYVNPGNPRQSVVDRRALRFAYLWPPLLVVCSCGLCVAFCGRGLWKQWQTRGRNIHEV
jgi:hypothetical protein